MKIKIITDYQIIEDSEDIIKAYRAETTSSLDSKEARETMNIEKLSIHTSLKQILDIHNEKVGAIERKLLR